MQITECRSCRSPSLRIILDLGCHPASNALLSPTDDLSQESRYPLQVAFCEDCAMLQLTETVPPEILYQRDFPYYSSSSPALLQHAADIAERVIRERQIGPDSLVVEIASNDGYLLHNFVMRGIPCLGVDPADGPAERARQSGIPTLTDFFSFQLADRLVAEGREADVMIANNVLAHIHDINDFVAGFARMLAPGGVAVFEIAYAVDMIQKCEFDTIYHEHHFYHTLHGLLPLFMRHGLHINDAERLSIHGGSLRIWVSHQTGRSAGLRELVAMERDLGVHRASWYEDFSQRVSNLRLSLSSLLRAEKNKGRRIAAYGAAAKGSTLVNSLDLEPGFFEFVADANAYKHGKLTPGQHIPIVHPDHLLESKPDLVLLLAWNFAGEVLHQQAAYRAAGGRFVIPIPRPRIIEPDEVIHEKRFALDPQAPQRMPAEPEIEMLASARGSTVPTAPRAVSL
ncbi:class I SAM-dependent methyltransferase [uncultured Ferrovibrio sp.]|jgi:2-polyprenyl-3-methyl-5-hydroxy-6-metoxy-1,4-benzoquinol methylase|uniref:class I SAM-dependent methyltransferase n=1 Tax=uncultured Ferrovibrio sp. TaxID=1576913 RepID=UPI00260626A9|nr:class I SAM-dependent methyltransferase [uncultured Ferrovibrio sp.]